MSASGPWAVHRRSGSARELHEPTPPERHEPSVVVCGVRDPAFVLGSTQGDEVVDRAAADARGIDIVRRRSGGGAVLLVPGDHVWIDVWLPRRDPRWSDDVVRAAEWLGDVWCETARRWGRADLEVHQGNATTGGLSSLVCFAGRGPGEVFDAGRKLVGVSQRRTRDWARFQCVVHRRWDAATTFALLSAQRLGEAAGVAPASVARDWTDRVATVGSVDVEEMFLDVLDQR